MMKLAQAALLIGLLLGVFHQSQAAVLIEPLVGYSRASVELESGYSINDESKFSGGGFSWGGRLGYQQLGFQLGVDYLNSSINTNDKALDKNLALSEWAGFVGFEFPILFRIYAGYIFSATGESEVGGSDVEFKKGSGSKVGLGFTGLPFIDINLEYRSGTFKDARVGGIDLDSESTYRAYMIGLSFPFTL